MGEKHTMREWRVLKGLTIGTVAEQLGVMPATYSAWEKNPEKITLGNLVKVSGVLDVPVNDIKVFPARSGEVETWKG